MRTLRTLAAATLAVGVTLSAAGTATAYTGTPLETGTGFVGKGELQDPWGWNNQTLQGNASGVSFTVESQGRYEYDCEWVTGEGTRGQRTHEVTHKRTSAVSSGLEHDLRTNGSRKNVQVTGFTLTGFSSTTVSGAELPAVGAPCLGQGAHGTVTDVRVLDAGEGARLLAHYPGLTSIVLQPTSEAVVQ